MLLVVCREVLGIADFVESNLPDFIFVLLLIYYMAFGRSIAPLYRSLLFKMKLYIFFSSKWVECQVDIKHKGEPGRLNIYYKDS